MNVVFNCFSLLTFDFSLKKNAPLSINTLLKDVFTEGGYFEAFAKRGA